MAGSGGSYRAAQTLGETDKNGLDVLQTPIKIHRAKKKKNGGRLRIFPSVGLTPGKISGRMHPCPTLSSKEARLPRQ